MKRLSFLMLLLLSVFATNVFAESEVSVWGGYAGLNVDKHFDPMANDFKKQLRSFFYYLDNYANAEALAAGPDADDPDADFMDSIKIKGKGKIDNAFTVGLDYFFGNGKNVKPGFRVACLQSSEKEVKLFIKEEPESSTRRSRNAIFIDFPFSFTPSVSSISVMFGGKVNYDISEEFSLNAKLFTGIAKINSDYGLKLANISVNLLSDVSKYAPAVDISAGAQYLFTKEFGLGLDLGYRFLPSASPSYPDCSGFTAKLGLNFKI